MATQAIELTTAWMEIGEGPMLIEAKHGQNLRVHFGSIAPALDSDAFHDVQAQESLSYGGTSKCFARATTGSAKVIVTEAADES
ncbi:MAG: hypothetical protein ACPGNV_14210 [Mangrovicoccus sp.]